MQRIFISTIAALLIITSFFACKKSDYKMRADYVDLSNKAFIRIIHASPSVRLLTGQRDTFNLYADGARISSPFLTYGSVFPVGTTSSYAAIDAGIKTFKLSIPGVFNPDSIQLSTFNDTLNPGTLRTLLLTDSVGLRINDAFSEPLTGLYTIRFIHAVMNDTIGKTVDIYSTRRNGNIFSNIKIGALTGFQTGPYNAQLNDTLFVRRSGTAINLAAGILPAGLAFLFNNQRAYTLIYRGDGKLTTGTKARTLSIITNQ